MFTVVSYLVPAWDLTELFTQVAAIRSHLAGEYKLYVMGFISLLFCLYRGQLHLVGDAQLPPRINNLGSIQAMDVDTIVSSTLK